MADNYWLALRGCLGLGLFGVLLVFFEFFHGNEIHGEGVYAVAGVFWGETFAEKYVAEVSVAVGAQDFSAPAVGVGFAGYRTFNFVVKTWPSAEGIEF